MDQDFSGSVARHDEMAPGYDESLSRNPTNALARRAFQDLVKRFAPPSATILDFGCGTGVDALHYAHQGHRVLTFDNSPGMVAQMAKRCAAEAIARTVSPLLATYPAFLAVPLPYTPQVVTANFAVLNSIADPAPLFQKFARELSAPALMLLSVLNPMHWTRLKMHASWRESQIYAHSPSDLLRLAPEFRLIGQGNAGNLVRFDSAEEPRCLWYEDAPVSPAVKMLWRTPAYKLLGHFIFLVLRRTA